MTSRSLEHSPQLLARLAGVLYLVTILLGGGEQVLVRGRIVVPGDVAATAANLGSMEWLWRFGIASEMVIGICTILLSWILYVLLRQVHKDLALLAVFFALVAVAVETAAALRLLEALLPLGNPAYRETFTAAQLATLSNWSIRAHGSGFGNALLCFSPFFFVVGYLIYKSGYLPRTIGLLYLIPGVSYLTSSFALILAPHFAHRYYFVIAGPALIGEGALCLWLLFKGVDVRRWDAATADHRATPR